jgi:hypothetical protein
MGFSNQERINMFTKALAAGVIDANSIAVWYETFFPFGFVLDQTAVWTQLSTVRQYPASNRTTARANVAGPLAGIVADFSLPAAAKRLTLVAGTNNSTYAAYSIYGDPSSPLLINWLLPQLVPQASGSPSNGYAIELYEGDPNAGGVLIPTTAGTTGTGVNKTVGWIFNYANGLLFLSDDFKASVTDPWIVGFQYIGTYAGTGGGGIVQGVEREEFAGSTFGFGSGISTKALGATPDTTAALRGIAELFRNGVADMELVPGSPTTKTEWRINGTTLEIGLDIRADGHTYRVVYPKT